MIDIHSHFFPPIAAAEAAGFRGEWPWLRIDTDDSGHIMRGDTPFRPVRNVLWDSAARLRDLDRHGITAQIISATPVLFGYDEDPGAAAEFARFVNTRTREFCARAPERLHSLCQVPLQDLRLACRELDHAMAAGHRGVQIGNHVGARDLDDPAILAFLTYCAEIGAPVFVHPWDMFGTDRMRQYMLPWLVGMPAETQLSILKLILSGAFERLPRKLKLCFAHGGGSFAYLLGRVDNAWRHRDIVRRDCPHPPSSYLDRFAVDAAVFDRGALALLVDRFTEDRVMFGTDYPFPLGEQTPGELIRGDAALSAIAKAKLLGQNARSFFGITAHGAAVSRAAAPA